MEDLLVLISEGLSQPISKEDINSKTINLNHLKRIDKIFNKGLNFYFDPSTPSINKETSIFFRKSVFGSELNLGATKIVNQFEELKIYLTSIAKLSDIKIDRKLPIFNISESPKLVAEKVRELLYPQFSSDKKVFLKSLIEKFADNNILVFEFVETWNKKDKANVDGFFLNPNVIVLKRQQSSFRREIFTLVHELGHYLINEEEVEQLNEIYDSSRHLSKIEKWCNDFAYSFLIKDYYDTIENIVSVNSANDYYLDTIEEISEMTHLSQISIYTRLRYANKISQVNYQNIKQDFDDKFRIIQEGIRQSRELDKLQGKISGGSTPKPINSPLLISTIQTAYYSGILNEFEVCKRLNITSDKLNQFIS
jgi:Zn-dependent peptidase ImmA (M78 family)